MYLLSAYVSTLEFAATIQDGVLKIHPQLLFFCCKGTDQHVRVRSKISLHKMHTHIYFSLTRKLGTLDFFDTGKIADTEVNAEKTGSRLL